MLVFREIRPKSEEVKAKNRKPPDARDARALGIAAVCSRCTFEEVLPIVAASQQLCGRTSKDGEGAEENEPRYRTKTKV